MRSLLRYSWAEVDFKIYELSDRFFVPFVFLRLVTNPAAYRFFSSRRLSGRARDCSSGGP